MSKRADERCRVFISYAHEDEKLKNSRVFSGKGLPEAFHLSLKAAFQNLEGFQHPSAIFFDNRSLVGKPEWKPAIQSALDECDLCIFLVSVHAISSDYCMNIELPELIAAGKAVVPVVLSETSQWIHAKIKALDGRALKSLGELHSGGLPKDSGNAKPVSAWEKEDAAWKAVCDGICEFVRGEDFKRIVSRLDLEGRSFGGGGDLRIDPEWTPAQKQLAISLQKNSRHAGLNSFLRGMGLSVVEGSALDGFCFLNECLKNKPPKVFLGAFLAKIKGASLVDEAMFSVLSCLAVVLVENCLREIPEGVAGWSPHHVMMAEKELHAALLAAQRLVSALIFKPNVDKPENFMSVSLPMQAFGYEQESSANLVVAELYRGLENAQGRHPDDVDFIDKEMLGGYVDQRVGELGVDVLVGVGVESNNLSEEALKVVHQVLCACRVKGFFYSSGAVDVAVGRLCGVFESIVKALVDRFLVGKA